VEDAGLVSAAEMSFWPFVLVLTGSLLAAACFAALWRWFGADAASSSVEIDPSMIAFGFPEEKYLALKRLLDAGEVRDLQRSRELPGELADRLAKGRLRVVRAYLDELEADFRLAQRVVAQSQSTSLSAQPSVVREIARGWIRFQRLQLKLRAKIRGGQLTFGEIEPLILEVRRWFERAGHGARGELSNG
jgi:hypothetical protein